MNFHFSSLAAGSALAFVTASHATAQVSFPEIEPNSTKAEATLVACPQPNDYLSGTTTGTVTTAGSGIITTVDTFRIKTCALVPGIYQHRLVISSITPGHTGTLRGLDQSGQPGIGGSPGTTDVAVQTSAVSTSPPRSNQWYGFGKAEEMYYRISGTTSTTGPYKVTYSRTVITPTFVATAFNPGPITISAVGQTTLNTDVVLVDGTYTILPGYTNDDTYPGGALQPTLTRTLAPGTYYVGITAFDLAQKAPAPADDANPFGYLLDFPNAVTGSSAGAGENVSFTISDGVHTAAVPASKDFAYQVIWVQFVVGNAPITPYCFGDGSGTACPCTAGGVGNGCPNSVNAFGGRLQGNGSASLANDTLVLHGDGMTHSISLFFQGLNQVHTLLGDGILCANGSLIRLGVEQNTALGVANFPSGSDPSISVKGQIQSAGDTRFYQAWYRDPANFCTAETFNTTNGIAVIWGP